MTFLAEHLDVVMLCVTFALLVCGYPVAFTLAGVALAFAFIGAEVGAFNLAFLNFIPQRLYGLMVRDVLIAVPLFVFMGLMLQRSRIAETLLEAMGRLFRTQPGGLAISVTLVGALLAAATGIVGATVVTMGLISLPVMLRHGYDPKLAAGTICASGTLGQVIPPSIVLVLLGDVLSAAHQSALLETGTFGARPVSVGDLFAGALLPGLLLVGLYLCYLLATAKLAPERCPPLPPAETDENGEPPPGLASAIVAPMILILAVLGSILGGLATPTEGAGVGAIGALLLGAWRLDHPGRLSRYAVLAGSVALIALIALAAAVDLRFGRDRTTLEAAGLALGIAFGLTGLAGIAAALWRALATGVLTPAVAETARLTTMLFTIVIGATIFTLVLRGLGGDDTIREVLEALPGDTAGAIILVMVVMFLMGFFLDFVEITLIVVPVVGPILLAAGVDPIWLGVMIAVNLQTSFLTPPFGFSLFYLRGVAPDSVGTVTIYRGALPFVGLQLVALAIVAMWPELATWLPHLLFG